MKSNESDIIRYISLKLKKGGIIKVAPSKQLIGKGISEEVIFKLKPEEVRRSQLSKMPGKSFPH